MTETPHTVLGEPKFQVKSQSTALDIGVSVVTPQPLVGLLGHSQ